MSVELFEAPKRLLYTILFRYIQHKSPGQQTVLDLCIQDGIIVWITRIVWTNVVIYIAMFYGELNFHVGVFLLFMLGFLLESQIAFGQMVLTLKFILIFKGESVGNLSDQVILWGFRIASVSYIITLKILHATVFAHPRVATLLELMTSTNEPT